MHQILRFKMWNPWTLSSTASNIERPQEKVKKMRSQDGVHLLDILNTTLKSILSTLKFNKTTLNINANTNHVHHERCTNHIWLLRFYMFHSFNCLLLNQLYYLSTFLWLCIRLFPFLPLFVSFLFFECMFADCICVYCLCVLACEQVITEVNELDSIRILG